MALGAENSSATLGYARGMVRQAEHLACRKRQPGTFAGVARTHSPGRGRRPQEDPCHGPCGPCVPVSERMEAGAPVEGIWTALGRVWGGGCLGQVMTR